MSNQVIPNTESNLISSTAIAWEIVKAVNLSYKLLEIYPSDEAAKRLTNAVIEIREAIYERKTIQLDNPK